METVLAAIVAFLLGCAVASVSYYISKLIIKKDMKHFSLISVFRQALNIGYLVAVYFVVKALDLQLAAPLVLAALGITLPMFYFTKKLVSLSDSDIKPPDGQDNCGEEK